MKRGFVASLLFAALVLIPARAADANWRTLPPTPSLPISESSGFIRSNDARIWYGIFGNKSGPTVTLLHGGRANANYWGYLIRALAPKYRVIVIDSRGQGRSPFDGKMISYELMAADVVAAFDQLGIEKSAIIGWSDGAITGYYLCLRHADRITGHFAFAGVYSLDGEKSTNSEIFASYIARTEKEYRDLSPEPNNFSRLIAVLEGMWQTQPMLTKNDLRKITVPTWVVSADRDEVIRESHAEEISAAIPDAKLVSLIDVSHFAMLQDPPQFNTLVLQFLSRLH